MQSELETERLVCTFRLTLEDLATSDTTDHTSPEVWDGDDVEYAITKIQWETMS